jgi:HEAT repeat protein
MKIFSVSALLIPLIVLLALETAIAQNGTVRVDNSGIQSFEDYLRERGIDPSTDSLLDALQNRDPGVRSMAALLLAQNQNVDAIAPIENALSRDPSPHVRIAMAQALWSLHDAKGLTYLQGMCTDASLSIYVLVEVVQQLDLMGESGITCIDPVLNYLHAESNSTDRLQVVISTLPRMYRWGSSEQTARIVHILEDALQDKDGTVRMLASHGLTQMKSYTSIGLLQKLVRQEKDEVVRASLQTDLDALQAK